MNRNQAIDVIRGIDLVFMVAFNYSVTLSYFGLIERQSDFLYSFIFPRAIAFIFIFLSGVAAFIGYDKEKDGFRNRYFRRGVKLLIFAAFVTLFTYLFVPEGTVFFGILHFFAATSFLLPFFIKYKRLNLMAGSFIILAGIYLQQVEFNFKYLFWLGFMPENLNTFDYFPLIPWLGVLMLGVYSGKYIVEKTKDIKFKNKLAGIFTFFGRNSLIIYLVHQPVLVVLLMVSGFKTF
ncbi:MAG: DUF1624 domain-containing protein [Candidatus Methanoperedens sp.]|nr:DUF1624 domain-containing protein [Candidatus Methanoperedens sp.]